MVIVQLASLWRGKQRVPMSTRSGEFVTLRDLVDEVGADAARFFYVLRSDQHLDFDLELAKSQSNENPVYYVQYAHARIASVLRRARESAVEGNGLDFGHVERLTERHELDLLKALSRYPEVIESAATACEPHQLAHYLRELATVFHSFYNAHTILSGDEDLKSARLTLAGKRPAGWSRTGSGCSESTRRRPCRANGDGEKAPDRSGLPAGRGAFSAGSSSGSRSRSACSSTMRDCRTGPTIRATKAPTPPAGTRRRRRTSTSTASCRRRRSGSTIRRPPARLPGRPSGRRPRPSTTTSAPPPDKPAPTASGVREYRVQVGSFRKRKEADRLRASLALGGFESSIRTRDTASGTWHRVTLGPFRGREAAEAAKARLLIARQGMDARIVPTGS